MPIEKGRFVCYNIPTEKELFMETKKLNARRFLSLIGLLLVGLSVCEFLIYYIFFGFINKSSILLILVSYVITFIEGLFPPLAATAIYFASRRSIKGKALIALALSSPKILYVFPRYYLYFVSDFFNSIESVMLSVAVSVLYVLYVFLQIFVCIMLLNHLVKRATDKESLFVSSRISNLEDTLNFGIILEVVFVFVVFLAKECYNTVTYFVEVGGGYTGGEIIAMVIAFISLPIFALFHYVICAPMKNKILAQRIESEKSECDDEDLSEEA